MGRLDSLGFARVFSPQPLQELLFTDLRLLTALIQESHSHRMGALFLQVFLSLQFADPLEPLTTCTYERAW